MGCAQNRRRSWLNPRARRSCCPSCQLLSNTLNCAVVRRLGFHQRAGENNCKKLLRFLAYRELAIKLFQMQEFTVLGCIQGFWRVHLQRRHDQRQCLCAKHLVDLHRHRPGRQFQQARRPSTNGIFVASDRNILLDKATNVGALLGARNGNELLVHSATTETSPCP